MKHIITNIMFTEQVENLIRMGFTRQEIKNAISHTGTAHLKTLIEQLATGILYTTIYQA